MDVVAICNLALKQVGGKSITSIDEDSTEAQVCKALYAPTRDAMLASHEWSFAVARLVLPADATAPAFGYTYAYTIPSTVLRVLWCDDGSGYRDIDFVREGNKILCDVAGPLYLRVLQRVEDTSQFSPGFEQALAFQVAASACVSLTENDAKLQLLTKLATFYLRDAVTVDSMQGSSEYLQGPDLLSRRGAR
jgi:hypothetical protein